MRLYKLERIDKAGWDEYSGFVIAANHHTIARKLAQEVGDYDCDWTSPKYATCTLIAKESVFNEQQIVLSDFRAG